MYFFYETFTHFRFSGIAFSNKSFSKYSVLTNSCRFWNLSISKKHILLSASSSKYISSKNSSLILAHYHFTLCWAIPSQTPPYLQDSGLGAVVSVLDRQGFVPNPDPFECRVCFLDVDSGQGVVLRDCLHTFCRLVICLCVHYVLIEEPFILFSLCPLLVPAGDSICNMFW